MANRESGLNIILLANEPRIFRELLHRALDGTPGAHLVVEVEDHARLPSILNRVQARWVFVTLDDHGRRPPLVKYLLENYPELSIVMISGDGGHVEIVHARDEGVRPYVECDNMKLEDLLEVVYPEEQSLSV